MMIDNVVVLCQVPDLVRVELSRFPHSVMLRLKLFVSVLIKAFPSLRLELDFMFYGGLSSFLGYLAVLTISSIFPSLSFLFLFFFFAYVVCKFFFFSLLACKFFFFHFCSEFP